MVVSVRGSGAPQASQEEGGGARSPDVAGVCEGTPDVAGGLGAPDVLDRDQDGGIRSPKVAGVELGY